MKVKSLVSSPFCLSKRLGEIDPQRAEGRNPVDADADRQARLGRIAEEDFLEARARSNRSCRVATPDRRRSLQSGSRDSRSSASSRSADVATMFEQLRLLDVPQRADVDEGRRPQTDALEARADRELELEPAHVISPAADRVGDVLLDVERCERSVRCCTECGRRAGRCRGCRSRAGPGRRSGR